MQMLYIWLLAAVVFGVLEGITAQLVSIWFVLGAVAALRRNKVIDKVIMVITTAFVSMPSFIMGSLLLVLFAVPDGGGAVEKEINESSFAREIYEDNFILNIIGKGDM